MEKVMESHGISKAQKHMNPVLVIKIYLLILIASNYLCLHEAWLLMYIY